MRLAVVGIDGGSWNVLRQLLREGYMPNLRRLIENGVHGDLRSVIPPVTGAAWLSMATGLNPGKTGVIDFFKHVGDFVVELVSSADFYEKSLWDYLSVLGFKVAVIDYPMLYPAYPINGVMVCSWGGRLSTYPEKLVDKVNSVARGYNIFVDYHSKKYDNVELFLEDLEKAIEKKMRVSRQILGRGEWNLFIDVHSWTDWLQHRMWHYIDPSHPLHQDNNEAVRYRRRIYEFWQILDEYLGEVAEVYDNVLIVSDHGFGPQWGVFNLARWLLIHGFAEAERERLKRRGVKLLTNIINKFMIYKLVPEKLRREVRKRGLSTLSPSFSFDLEKSRVITLDYTIPFGAVHINPKLRSQAEKTLEELEYALSRLTEEFGRELTVSAWRVKDLYWGGKVNLLPDLVFTINNWSCVVIKDTQKDFIYFDAPYSPRHTGSHRLYGIFVAQGSDFKKCLHIGKVSVFDIAPTVLFMFNSPIPNEMDGRALKEILKYGKTREPKHVSPLYYRVKFAKKRLKQ